ncbi:MAG TPA: phosphoenolpyruvate carboxykinase (ATP) [Candidatus Sabulitectum sp.]|nr:phosphoenolpyruvate carboxykinase (ATP) [Candidatus Sabulitectum sp.]HPJ27288.1 phosphoenolpyruvate carboxykinase (ATP) [Candidatus Sabulitectum sp.]HPR21155.1 phosphoenolpyruvate carboxykinase (ATP) [Candidatus Sabulitectum sp.]
MMSLLEDLDGLLARMGSSVRENISREEMIQAVVDRREAVVMDCGALATWTRVESTGRSPKDTVIVKRESSEGTIDWTSPNNLPIQEDTFDMAWEEILEVFQGDGELFVTDRVIGADPRYSLPVRVVTDNALTALFTDNMFRPCTEKDLEKSIFRDRRFTLLASPNNKMKHEKYEGRLRSNPSLGHTSNMMVGMDMDRGLGIVFGSAYCGSIKKLMFTVMNYMLPAEGILPIHCSANEGEKGDCALLLGLSGTGKTTLSADPSRALLGDDEHGWSDNGIANFENGCYAKLIDLNPEKEPEIYSACFHEDHYLKHGSIIENVVVYPNGEFDLSDDAFTPNTRGSYPLRYLSNIKESSVSGHPGTILFLTADANSVIPPVSKLTREQAMLWFLMGYTSKLAGTETGIKEPVSTFSRFFGEPFMPRLPEVYADLLGRKMEEHGTQVYLINTGWTGGPYGTGSRIDLPLTRKMVNACLTGEIEKSDMVEDPFFKVMVPTTCPGIEDSAMLQPGNTWKDREAYEARARKLAGEFADHFRKAYGDQNIPEDVVAQCPGI